MSRNIKEIGKELLGKSLNSFHRKTGLTQLEKNNEMQDGILDGILSQVDDAYIKKTEQSNVIHLDGSGDGVVVLDSIEGNTMVNIMPLANWGNKSSDNRNCAYSQVRLNTLPFKPNTTYTTILLNAEGIVKSHWMHSLSTQGSVQGTIATFTTISDISMATSYLHIYFGDSDNTVTQEQINNIKVAVLEGDWTNKEINYFEGLQSSFEEQVEDNKYKIEILMNNKNLYKPHLYTTSDRGLSFELKNDILYVSGTATDTMDYRPVTSYGNKQLYEKINKLPIGTKISLSNNLGLRNYFSLIRNGVQSYIENTLTVQEGDYKIECFVRFNSGTSYNNKELNIQIEINDSYTDYISNKQNKIKLLLDEPLRSLPNGVRDRLCVVNNKLVVERMCKEVVLNGKESDWSYDTGRDGTETKYFRLSSYRIEDYFAVNFNSFNNFFISDRYKCETASNNWKIVSDTPSIDVNKDITISVRDISSTLNEFKEKLSTNNIKLVYQLSEPYYEEVLNEYGEPILLEGYENGTIYIDSTIVPTTTVRYTPKMESFKTLKEVENNNIMLTNDVNDNIIPYMMDVDLMIMEKEMALMSHKNIRKMEVLDMTSMQKRTQDMLERLIKGKTLTEQECKTRVTTYLHAGKITDEQAEELMLLISEVYA